MKRGILRRIGKRGKINIKANRILKEKYKEAGINTCEICGNRSMLSWHHKHRRYYYKTAEELSGFSETILLCLMCHSKYIPDSKDTMELFNKLRKNAIYEGPSLHSKNKK